MLAVLFIPIATDAVDAVDAVDALLSIKFFHNSLKFLC
jgi:hypothetical protein